MSKEECCAGAGAGERVVVVVVAAAALDERCRAVICRSWLACRSCFSIELVLLVVGQKKEQVSDKPPFPLASEISRFVASVLVVQYPI